MFVENGKVTGIIDFERALWGDPLMEVGFRSYGQSADFLKGYGKTEFTAAEKTRILWYDIYLFLLLALECDYRKYETDETYRWSTEMLVKYMERVL
ncbi:MAG: phosphotransferase [Eubacteriales bacterium]|nr:phosphotransferase [Eubacteriales bacterium]